MPNLASVLSSAATKGQGSRSSLKREQSCHLLSQPSHSDPLSALPNPSAFGSRATESCGECCHTRGASERLPSTSGHLASLRPAPFVPAHGTVVPVPVAGWEDPDGDVDVGGAGRTTGTAWDCLRVSSPKQKEGDVTKSHV